MNRKLLPITLITLLALLLSVSGATGQGPGPERRVEPLAADAQPQGAASIAATVNSRISYQGLLEENGIPVTGSRDMTFRLYGDVACTTQVGSDIVKSGVQVTEGLFSVELDVAQGDFNGRGLWLQVEVGGTAIGCREVLPAPYALSLRPGAHIVGEETGSATLAVRNHSSDDYSTGLSAYNLADSGLTVGVWGQTSSSTDWARGVFGVATASSGETWGVYGRSDSSTDGAIGVHGLASASSGLTSGVVGRTDSSTDFARGVFGVAAASSGITSGVRGHSHSTSGHGVSGRALATSGYTYGVFGRSDSTSGQGVHGWATATSGETYAVYGQSDSTSGYGGYFVNANQTCSPPPPEIDGAYDDAAERSIGCGVGVYGEAATGVIGNGTEYFGVQGVGGNVGVTGQGGHTGVSGYTDSSAPSATGVVGGATASSGQTYGVYGYTNSSTNLARGVYGSAGAASGDTFGVYGSNNSPSGAGVYGRATDTSGTRRGVHGSVAGSGYGLYTEDELYVGGSCTGCLVTFIARNTSEETLQVGDVLAASDVGPILQGHTTPVIQVRRATAGDASVLGVVYLRGEFYAASGDSPEEDGDSVQPVEGDVAPGDYLLVATSGLAQVRVAPDLKGIAPGQSLTVGDINGLATQSETGARPDLVFGRAMEAQPDENGLLWAMIGTQ